jgi:hypothetical protein
MQADQLQSLVQILAEQLASSVENTRHAVRWLRVVLRANIDKLATLTSVHSTLRSLLPYLKKKEQLLPVVCRMKGKLDVLIEARRRRKLVEKEKNELDVMKPLIEISGGRPA